MSDAGSRLVSALSEFFAEIVREELRAALAEQTPTTTSGEWATDYELAKLIKISRTKLKEDRYRGVGPPYTRVGRVVRYHVPTVQAWLAERSIPRKASK